MGEQAIVGTGFKFELLCEDKRWEIDRTTGFPLTEKQDTQLAVNLALEKGVDVLLFAGGDGTARDVAEALPISSTQVCLGIPCGVKIQSGVFGKTPSACAGLLKDFLSTGCSGLEQAEVRDIDENALRNGILNSRVFSELWVLKNEDAAYAMQGSKMGSQQVSFGKF